MKPKTISEKVKNFEFDEVVWKKYIHWRAESKNIANLVP